MDSPYKDQHIGPCLVIGGSGFIGSHVVERLLAEPAIGPITVVSRQTHKENAFPNATYATLDVSDAAAVQELVAKTAPAVIFHVAAPRAIDPANTPATFYETIVQGTENVINAARASSTVQALVYTSSCSVHKGYVHIDITEDAPLWGAGSSTIPYFTTKTVADTMVLAANKRADSAASTAEGALLTVALRLAMCYGERDGQSIPGQLGVLQKGQTKVQLGDGSNRVDPLYGPVAGDAHVLAAKALLAAAAGKPPPPDKKVDGEAFLVTNGNPQPFWDFSRRIWRLAGDNTDPSVVTKVPSGLALAVASMVEWAFAIFTLGYRKPPLNLTPLYIGYACRNTTYCIDKARARLGFHPSVDLNASLRSSVRYTLQHDPQFAEFKLTPPDDGM